MSEEVEWTTEQEPPPDPSLIRVDLETGEITQSCQDCLDKDDIILGLKKTIEFQARKVGALERALKELEDEDAGPDGWAMRRLFQRWQKATGHKRARFGTKRMKMVKARISEEYPFTSEEAEPTMELAVDGVCAYPYKSFGKRKAQGSESDLADSFDEALKDEKALEENARLGWKARRLGWTPEKGWPDGPPKD